MEHRLPQDLVIVEVNGENRIDSRMLATRLNYEHKVILQSIRRHKDRLEAKSSLLHCEAVKQRESRGATREVYYMLDERQCLILAGSLKKGAEADEWHDKLVDAFLSARKRIDEQSSAIPFNKDVQSRCIANEKLLPSGYWCVVNEMYKEALIVIPFQKELKDWSLPDGSCGRKWRGYCEREDIDISQSFKHALWVPNQKFLVGIYTYPYNLLDTFRAWLRTEYAEYYDSEYSPLRLKNTDHKQIS